MKDNLFGTLAVRGHFVLTEQVNEALAVQLQFEQGGQKPPRLGEILAAKGYMTPEQVQAVLRGQGSPQGKQFGQIATAWHFCTQEDVDSAALFQQEQRALNQRAPRLGEILVSRGAMKPHQIRAVLQGQGKSIVMCPSCGTRYNAINVQAKSKLKCPRCQAVFAPFTSTTRPDEDVRADITVSLPAVKVNETQTVQGQKMEVGPYQLVTKLGADHSGILYKALHPQTGNHVALRLLSNQVMQGAEEFDLWVSAGQTATELNHPNLQRIQTMGSEGGRAYLVMEFVEGKSLRQRLMDQGRLQPLEALEIMIQAGDALAYGHARDLVHGDLRPNHILIGLDGRVRLAGLGTPKQVHKDLRLMAEEAGNVPLYTAPEVLIDENNTDELSDVYSLCAIGYHMLTGKPVQDGEDVMQAGMRVAAQDIALPRSLDPGIPPYLERLLLKSLSADPEDRYASMTALLADLRKCRGGMLIQTPDLPDVAPEIRPGAPKAGRVRARRTGKRLTTHLVRSGRRHKSSAVLPRVGTKTGMAAAVKIPANARASGVNASAKSSGMHPSAARTSGLAPAIKRADDAAQLTPEEALAEWQKMNEAAPAAGEQAMTNLTPTGQPAVGQARRRKGVSPPEREIPPVTIISVILGSALALLLVLLLLSSLGRQENTEQAKNDATQEAVERLSPEQEAAKKHLAKATSDYNSIVDAYVKVNPHDHKGILRAIDQYLGKYEKSQPLPPQVATASTLRAKTAEDAVTATLPALREAVQKMAAEDRYTEAAAEIAKWQTPWGEAGATAGKEEAQKLEQAEKTAAEAQFMRVKTLRDGKDYAGAFKLCDEIAKKFSPAFAARAKEEKALTEKTERESKSTAHLEEERKRREQQAAEREKNAPARFAALQKELQTPLKSLDMPFTGQLLEQAAEALTGTAKGPDLQSLKGEIKLYQDLLERMNKAAKEGKLRDMRVKYQGETVAIIDSSAQGPVVEVKGGRVDAKWPELEAEALIEIARRVSAVDKAPEIQGLGQFLMAHDRPYDAEKAFKAAKLAGAVVDDQIKRALERQKEIAASQPKTEDEPAVPGRWTAPAYVKLPLGKQDDVFLGSLKDLGWEVSKGTWVVTSERTLFGEKSPELALVSLKRDIKRFNTITVDLRGSGDAIGFSFGKGLRFLVKPSGRWQKFGLEIAAGDVVKFTVDGAPAKSIEDTGEVNSEKLGDALFLRCEGSHFEARDFKIDGRIAGEIEQPFSLTAEAAKKVTAQRAADTDRLKAWGWEVSEGIWTASSEQGFAGVPAAASSQSNLKRDLGKFSSISVDFRGDGEGAGFSFGKGMRFLAKPTGKWQTLKLEVFMGDELRMLVNGEARKSIEEASNIKTSHLPGILYLRGQGGIVEFRNFMIDGKPAGAPEAVKPPQPGPGPENEPAPGPAAAQDAKETEALAKLGWEISKGVWRAGSDGIMSGMAAADSQLISLKGKLKPFSTLTVEMRGDADAAGFSFGTGMRFVIKPGDKWQIVKLQVVEGDRLQLLVDGEPRNSLEDVGKVTSDQFADSVYLRAEGKKIEFRNFKLE